MDVGWVNSDLVWFFILFTISLVVLDVCGVVFTLYWFCDLLCCCVDFTVLVCCLGFAGFAVCVGLGFCAAWLVLTLVFCVLNMVVCLGCYGSC